MAKLIKGTSTQRVASAAKERAGNRSPSANGMELWPSWILSRVSEKKVETEVHNGSGGRWREGKGAPNCRI